MNKNFRKFHENPKKNKLQLHEKLHKNMNENTFSFTFYANFHEIIWRAIKATNIIQLYTAYFLYVFESILNGSKVFPILMVEMLLSQIQQAPGPNFRKVGKSLCLLESILSKLAQSEISLL